METEFEKKLEEVGVSLEVLKINDPVAYAEIEKELEEHFDAILEIIKA